MNYKKTFLSTSLLMAAVSLAACAGGPSNYAMGNAAASVTGLDTYKSGQDFSQDTLENFVKGTTTEAEIVAALGEPGARSMDADGNSSLSYDYFENKETTTSAVAGVVSSMSSFVSPFIGSEDETKAKYLTVNLRDGVYTGYNIYTSQKKSGRGLVRQ